jgi:hypothetical protein
MTGRSRSPTHPFGDRDGQEKFREVTPRSNPLDSLSTGERRLATMLPLLAAAWSMYSGDYKGPRLLSIDEIDAAFDEPNLRQVLTCVPRNSAVLEVPGGCSRRSEGVGLGTGPGFA